MFITAYTDGSAHPPSGIGAWATIFVNKRGRTVFQGIERDVTHQRMELLAVIRTLTEAMQMSQHQDIERLKIKIYSDSQYVVGLQERKDKILQNHFRTKRGEEMRHADLLKTFFHLDDQISIFFIKVIAHQKTTQQINLNREVDKMCRKLLRQTIKQDREKNKNK